MMEIEKEHRSTMQRVLVVSRDSDAGDLYGITLANAAGAQTVWVADASAAHRLIAWGQRFDAVVFDVTLPSEWEACEGLAVRDDAPPMVVITGWIARDRRFRHRAFDAGCAAFVAKPCDPRLVVQAIERVLHGERNLEFV